MNALLNWLKWRIAAKDLHELDRWRVEYEILSRWLAEFPDVATALDHLQKGAVGAGGRPSTWDLRAAMRFAARNRLAPAHQDVLAERRRQIEAEGWTLANDDGYSAGDLASAAACYATQGRFHYPIAGSPPPNWPWIPEWWKPKSYRENLVRAGALILAEIERIDRAAAAKTGGAA